MQGVSDNDSDVLPVADTADADDRLAEAFAAIDAAIAKSDRALINGAWQRQSSTETTLTETISRPEPDPLVYDQDWNEDQRLTAWRAVVEQSRTLPPTLAAAIAADAWTTIEPLQHAPWLGRLLVATLLRQRGKTHAHLACLHQGFRLIPHERRRPHDPANRLAVQLEAMTLAAEAGLKDHDRWMTARTLLLRKLEGRRSTSRLPALIDYVLSRPIVSAGMIADELKITPYAAQILVAELGLREATGRRRYRAWGIL